MIFSADWAKERTRYGIENARTRSPSRTAVAVTPLSQFSHQFQTESLLDGFARGRDAENPLLVACHFSFGFVNQFLDVVRVGRHFFGYFKILDGF